MKYFTQDLIVRGQSRDGAVLDEVETRWDEMCHRYTEYLDNIRADMPPGVRQRVNTYYLHDAVIHGMGQQRNSFVIVLQLDTPPQSMITFMYDLMSDPVIQRNTLPSELATGSIVQWQYDEIEMVLSSPATWRQAILLSNGWEVQLHFRDVAIQEMQSLIPAPRNGQASGATGAVTSPA